MPLPSPILLPSPLLLPSPVNTSTVAGPINGPGAPWITESDVRGLYYVNAAAQKAITAGSLSEGQVDVICARAAIAASEVLYELSGRTFTGHCGPVTVRPVARPTDVDTRAWAGRFASWSGSWGVCGAGLEYTGVASHFGCSNPPEIDLGAYPVTSIDQVKIDGVVIPPDEYALQNFRTLVRMRTSATAQPTERYGWPTCQLLDLPDTEEGTFSVTYRYGQAPPLSGLLAASKLAEYLTLPQLGDNTKYPQRVTNVSRQGVSAMIVDVVDLMNKGGSTGIYEVDLFIRSVNPKQLSRQSAVWSPDVGRPRRTP